MQTIKTLLDKTLMIHEMVRELVSELQDYQRETKRNEDLIRTLHTTIETQGKRIASLQDKVGTERRRSAKWLRDFGLVSWEENEASRTLGYHLVNNIDQLGNFMYADEVNALETMDPLEATLKLMNELQIPYEDAAEIIDKLQES